MSTRPVWAEIALDRLTANYHFLRQSVASAVAAAAAGSPLPAPGLLAIVKANAYGHGVELCGPALAAAGARWLGVTSVDEGVQLRRALGVLPSHLGSPRILVMSSLWHGEADTLLDRSLTPVVWEPYHFELLVEAARRRNLGRAKIAANIPVHLEIDTGMARQGVAPGQPLAALIAQYRTPSWPITIEGVMTHFRAPEMLAEPDTDQQLARFASALDQLAAAGLHPHYIHAGNSPTAVHPRHTAALAVLAARYHTRTGEPAQLMLRPGLALYGYPTRFRLDHAPSDTAALDEPAKQLSTPLAIGQSILQPVLTWKTRITSIRTLVPGEGVGYNSIYRAARPSRLALVPAGYADGLNRLLSNPIPSATSAMLVRGQRAPIAGRISMDQTMLDITDIPSARIGDEVVILGEQGKGHQGRNQQGAGQQPAPSTPEPITAWEHADLCQTIPYEILCNIAQRVPRLATD
jgi:alanine racemase